MRIIFTLFASALLCIFTHATTKIAVANSGNGWGTQTNWLPTGVPQDGDEVVVPPGITLTVKGNFYGTPSNIKIYVHGTLDFDPSGKLNLGTSSTVQLSLSGRITSNGTASEQIIIGGGMKYNGSNDGTITGPAFTTNNSPNSTSSKAKTGFTFGVLPVILTSFTAQEKAGVTILRWITELEEGLKAFEVQRSMNGKDWKTIATLHPRNTCGCATSYHYEDKAPQSGVNYYRLRLAERDDNFELSAVLMTKSNSLQSKDVVWSMNSAHTSLIVSLNSAGFQFPVQMQLLSSNGQMLLNRNLVSTNTSLDIKPIWSGISILVLQDRQGKKAIVKMVK